MPDMHLMGIGMNNMCGMPTTDPGGRGLRATSAVADVTCRECLGALRTAIHDTAEIVKEASDA